MRFSERCAVATASLSFFISTLDTGIVNVALPQLAGSLHIDAGLAAWTISAYALALSATILVFGRLADRLGASRISGAGFILFAVFSVGCAIAPTVGALIALRALTGIAAAMLQATAASFVSHYVEGTNRGRAFGWVSSVLSLGVVLGPSVGGIIVSFASWRWIFLAAVPFGIAGLIIARMLAPYPKIEGEAKQSESQRLFGIARITPFLCAVALGATFIAVFVGAPFELVREAHLQSWQVGLVLLATPLAASVAARVTGALVQRGYGIASMIVGLAVDGVAAWILLTTPATNIAAFAVLLLAFGLGSGAMQTPTIALSLAAFPASAQSTAGAMQRFVQNIAISAAAAFCGYLIDRFGNGSVWIFTSAVAFAAIAGILALSVASTRGSTRSQQQRALRSR
jgi:MFS family permease